MANYVVGLPYLAATVVTVIMIWAGAAKLTAREDFVRTLQGLGFATSQARWVAVVLPTLEVATGILIQVYPTELISRLAVLSLGMLFATAGVIALQRNLHIDCACLGAPGGSRLGWRQIAALPLWASAIALMSLPMALPRLPERALDAAVVTSMLAMLQARLVVSAWLQARMDRRATEGG